MKLLEQEKQGRKTDIIRSKLNSFAMDLIKSKNGMPANFLDVGGRATDEQVIAALKIMDSDPNV